MPRVPDYKRLTLIMFYSDVSDCAVELEGEREDVVVVTAVSDNEGPVRFVKEESLGSLSGNWTPVPSVLKTVQTQN